MADMKEKLTALITTYMEFVRSATPKEMATYLVGCGVVVREKGEWLNRHGRPVPFDDKDNEPTDSCHCSLCGEWLVASDEYAVKGSFCPNCGADMRYEQAGLVQRGDGYLAIYHDCDC